MLHVDPPSTFLQNVYRDRIPKQTQQQELYLPATWDAFRHSINCVQYVTHIFLSIRSETQMNCICTAQYKQFSPPCCCKGTLLAVLALNIEIGCVFFWPNPV